MTRPARSIAPFFLALALSAAFAAGLGGCSTAKPPRFETHLASVTATTNEGVAFEFLLDAYNDNDFGLPLRTLDYQLDIDGQTVFRGTRSAEATIRANGQHPVRVTASAPVGQSADTGERLDVSGLRQYVLTGSVTYVTPGAFAELLFDQGVRVPSQSFRVEGQIDIPPAATASAASPTAHN